MHISLLSSSILLAIPLASAQLNLWARASKKIYFGTATDNPELIDAPYFKQLKNIQDFGQLTPFRLIIAY
ncbi:glycoside hydrolase family 10 protein [Hypholoma sublateritium FD-334 SS-4]|uniref:Glycoside hydrolase family 10 protein n=1 Tax=Hypholoma sublateritium (strain FD-334 SS-4) TaxID=945553 RepID=A0A0D2P1K6_HYPSF|nr:glycoside hydrolase family 10 protein [Hypholoma sublateritium FD-334 SS-4]